MRAGRRGLGGTASLDRSDPLFVGYVGEDYYRTASSPSAEKSLAAGTHHPKNAGATFAGRGAPQSGESGKTANHSGAGARIRLGGQNGDETGPAAHAKITRITGR